MAVSNLTDDELEQQALAGGGAYIGGGSAPAAATPAPTSSGSYTNLTSYLDANAGNDQRMGSLIGGKVAEQGQAADEAMGGFKTAGETAIDAGTVNVDQNVMGQIQAGTPVADSAALEGIDKGVNAAPVSYSGPDTVDATYKGPQGYSSINGYLDTVGKVDQLGQSTSAVSKGQIEPFLKDINSGQKYSSGENLLDTFLTKAGPGGKAELDKIGTQWGGKGKEFEGIRNQLQGKIDTGWNTSKDTQGEYDTAIKAGKGAADTVNGQYTSAWNQYLARPVAPPPPPPAPEPDLNVITSDPFAGGNYNVDLGYIGDQVDAFNRSVAAPAYTSNMMGDGTFGGGAIANASKPTGVVDQRGTPRAVPPRPTKAKDTTKKYPGINKTIRGK